MVSLCRWRHSAVVHHVRALLLRHFIERTPHSSNIYLQVPRATTPWYLPLCRRSLALRPHLPRRVEPSLCHSVATWCFPTIPDQSHALLRVYLRADGSFFRIHQHILILIQTRIRFCDFSKKELKMKQNYSYEGSHYNQDGVTSNSITLEANLPVSRTFRLDFL